MKLSHDSIKPIYIQIAEGIEDDILDDILLENKQAYSQYHIAKQFNINPATAAKGINMLVHEGILYKKRGMGMHVSEGAKEMIQVKRKENFYSTMLKSLLIEAKKIGISKEEILDRINQMIDAQ
ncbi:GntR family transcriptional regulator [Vallitalea pronyensis]|uniref:GntR family transcriptional regulator n=1 Tax=Vallitalea pronyensis TaxID=1348613 RepID=A0A8J8MLZ3_9FIRM|nr:GntR family transcriptional regulator [Vallitalea pronyensis]QUI23748.1 GntR family transcriptional regulator [Vallitalea pronyensis]